MYLIERRLFRVSLLHFVFTYVVIAYSLHIISAFDVKKKVHFAVHILLTMLFQSTIFIQYYLRLLYFL